MGARIKLGQLLVEKGLIAREQLAAALGEQRQWGNRLGATLLRMGFLDEETLVRTLAAQLRVPVARIKGKTVNGEVLAALPVELAEKYRCLPLFYREDARGRVLYLGMEDPSDLEALDELAFRSGERIEPVLVAPSELDESLHRHYHDHAAPVVDSDLPPLARSGAAAAAAQAEPLPPLVPEVDTAPAHPEEVPDPNDLSLDPLSFPLGPGSGAGGDSTDPLSATPPYREPGAADPGDSGVQDPDSLSFRSAAARLGEKLRAGDADLGLDVDFDAAVGELGREAEPRPDSRSPDAGAARDPGGIDPELVMKALSQLLVEKGVVSREEFAERLRRLGARKS